MVLVAAVTVGRKVLEAVVRAEEVRVEVAKEVAAMVVAMDMPRRRVQEGGRASRDSPYT